MDVFLLAEHDWFMVLVYSGVTLIQFCGRFFFRVEFQIQVCFFFLLLSCLMRVTVVSSFH